MLHELSICNDARGQQRGLTAVGDDPSPLLQEPASSKDKRPAGIFGQWLRRRDASPARPASVVTKEAAAATGQEEDTATWSEGSGTSEFANLETQSGPSITHSASAESVLNTSLTDQQSSAKLAGRLGGWFTGMSNAAGQACMQACFVSVLYSQQRMPDAGSHMQG